MEKNMDKTEQEIIKLKARLEKSRKREVSEKRTEQEVQVAVAYDGCTLMKNNVGSAFRGQEMTLKNFNGIPEQRVIAYPQIIRYGLGSIKGGSDQIGMTSMMVDDAFIEKYKGRKVAVFTALEIKKDLKGPYKATTEQKAFGAMVIRNGGIFGVCDSINSARAIIKKGF